MQPDLLTASELATALRISVCTVNRLRRAGRIPYIPAARGQTRYRLEPVVAALEVPAEMPTPDAPPITPAQEPLSYLARLELVKPGRQKTASTAAQLDARIGRNEIAARG